VEGDISYCNLSCSFNHAYAVTNPGTGKDLKREVYSWGYDGFTGRTGLGYIFNNPEKEDDQ
jgi:hypothetical protein